MTSGIIGAGNIGGVFAKALGKAGIEPAIANSRGPDSIAGLASTFGGSIRAGTVKEAAARDFVLVAVQ
ncbi:NAD(P)-binding domain-containing protein [Sphingopyxis sp. JAI108]|uniref:NAD(P)-binding domain-containing protein n=1 Tax=Sphingopyxis sp. JAI108 TaxID=2723060 RepID=UPI0017F4C9BB|nr:NAD(P)-binding domain-containing protein [Sphingopyxis sp. JAI108]NYF30586.1 putative dinucleotide-binding enzyme [Sphingopyxis sp. JAI108]